MSISIKLLISHKRYATYSICLWISKEMKSIYISQAICHLHVCITTFAGDDEGNALSLGVKETLLKGLYMVKWPGNRSSL